MRPLCRLWSMRGCRDERRPRRSASFAAWSSSMGRGEPLVRPRPAGLRGANQLLASSPSCRSLPARGARRRWCASDRSRSRPPRRRDRGRPPLSLHVALCCRRALHQLGRPRAGVEKSADGASAPSRSRDVTAGACGRRRPITGCGTTMRWCRPASSGRSSSPTTGGHRRLRVRCGAVPLFNLVPRASLAVPKRASSSTFCKPGRRHIADRCAATSCVGMRVGVARCPLRGGRPSPRAAGADGPERR